MLTQKNRIDALTCMHLLVSHLRTQNITHTGYISRLIGEFKFSGSSALTRLKLQKDVFEPMNLSLIKIRKSRWTDNAYIERTHRTEDKDFIYLNCLILIIFRISLELYRYVLHFNTKRLHYGKYMNESSPFEVLKRFMPNISKSISYLVPLIFDFVSSDNIMLSQTILRSF